MTPLRRILFVGCLNAGCLVELDDPIIGFLWGVNAEPANGTNNNSLADVQIVNEDTETWMRGEDCFCPEVHAIMLDGINDELTPMSAEEILFNNLSASLRAEAEALCATRVITLQMQIGASIVFNQMGDVDCDTAVDDEEPFFVTLGNKSNECLFGPAQCDGDPTPIQGSGGDEDEGDGDDEVGDGGEEADETAEPPPSWGPDHFDLTDWSDAIDCPSSNNCRLDVEWLDYLHSNLALFHKVGVAVDLDDSASMHRGFHFVHISTDSIADALGFQEGDVVWEINGDDLQDFEDVTNIMIRYNQEETFTVKVDRGMSLVTKTFLRQDLTTYP